MRLGTLAKEFSASAHAEEDKVIDFAAASLYLPGAQTIFATVLSSVVSVLACWLSPVGSISAVRTLALTATAGALVIRKPLKVGNTRGVNTVFSALRPAPLLYVSCLVLEQLVHTCVVDDLSYEHGFWRRVIYHSAMSVMTVAAFVRSRSPRAENDVPFLVSAACVLAVALLPPPALALSGPLCAPPTLFSAAERVVRSFLFALVYVCLVYSAAPLSNTLADCVVCVARSASSSAWVLGATLYSLPLSILQVGVVVYSSFKLSALQYENVGAGLEEARADVHARKEAPSVAGSVRADSPEPLEDATPAAVELPLYQNIKGNNLSFSLAIPAVRTSGMTEKRLAEIAQAM
jgi:hypothetical protein